MSSIKIWHKVPGGSRLELSVAPDSGDFVSGARFRTDEGEEEVWEHAQICPGPKKKQLKKGHDYAVTVRVEFLSAADSTATLTAQIVKPDGTIHSDPFVYPMTGSKGDIARATIGILMQS